MRAARSDANHVELCEAFRGMGCSVLDLRLVGGGCPDLLVGIDGRSVLVEIKAPAGPRGGTSHRELSHAQIGWRQRWRGESAHTVRSVEEAVALVKAVRSVAEWQRERDAKIADELAREAAELDRSGVGTARAIAAKIRGAP